MRIVKWVFSIVLWTVIALNVIAFGVTRLPVAQRFLGDKVSGFASDLLGTQVSVGRVDLGLPSRLILDDLVILDQQQQEMIRAARVSVKMDVLPMLEGKVAINSAQLFGARFRLYKPNADTQTNFQFLLDSLASKDTTTHKPIDVRVNSLIVRHASLAYNQLDQPETEGHFNPSHLQLDDISAHINLRALTDDSLNVNVKRLSFNERSGLAINRLGFRVEAGRQHALLRDFLLEMPSTQVKIDTVTASYQLNGQELIKGSLSFAGNISDTYITPSDLRCFEPTLKNYQRPLNLTAAFNGSDLRLNVPNFRLNTSENDVDIHVDGWLEDYRHPSAWHLQMRRIQLSDASIDFLSKVIPGCPSEITRLDGLQMLGTFDQDHNGLMSLQSTILSGAGNIDVQGTKDRQQHFNCILQTEKLNLRQLLNDPDFGSLIARFSLQGDLSPHTSRPSPFKDIQAEGIISHFDFKGYPYQNIHLDGDYANNRLSGAVSIDDPNIKLDLIGQLGELVTKARHDVMIDCVINHFAPAALHLSDELEEGVISGDIHADFTASSLNDAQGTVRISNGSLSATTNHRAYRLDNLIVTSGYENDIHFVSLKSDFADATIRGEFDYATLPQSIIGLVGTRLPTLPGLPPVRYDTNNNFSLRFMVSKTDWLQRFLGVELVLRQPLMLNARVNDHTREIYLEGDIPAFTYNGAQYTDGIVNISTPGDTLKCDVGISKLLDDGHAMTAIANVRAANNKLNTSLSWDNHNPAQQVSGQMNGIIQLYHNLYHEPEAHMRVIPSHIVLKDGMWEVEPADIIYNKHHLLVDNFMVRRGKQHILIDGIASKNHQDSLSVDLNQVEVEYILDLVDFHSVEFSGKATGRATGRALFDKFAASADIRVDDFKFEKGRMGVLHANANWNQDAEQIDIRAVAKDGPGVNTYVNGYISPIHNTIDLDIRADSTYIDFMHSFTQSFISQITGHTSGDLRLAGTLDNINLTGQLVVGGNLTIEALNTTYYLDRDTVTFIPDDIRLNRLPLQDRDGNQAYLSGGIHHRHLTHLTFDLQAEANNLLAYDFPDFGESAFYGTVYATGTVDIKGRPGEVSIDCSVTPQKNSFFVYNAANPDAVSRSEFIVWENEYSRKEEGGKENTLAEETAAGNDLRGNPVPRSSFLLPRDRTDIYLNLLISATPDATLRLLMDASTNDYITLNGDGAIRATYHNKGGFNMFGTYNVDHGTYGVTIQNIIHKNFIFNPGGTIIFSGDPYQAALNLQAVHTVSGVSLSDLNVGSSFSSNTIRVNCLMNISGIAAAPQVDFDLEMPTVNADEQQMIRSIINGQQEMNQQVIYLLGIGRFYTQGVNSMANNQQNAQTSLAMQSLLSSTLSAQINNILNQFVKNDNWNFGANITTGDEGWHNAEYEGIVNARMLNNRLVFNGQFGYRDNAKQAAPSFIGDFDVQYFLNPNGNLGLKVYNQTNDRYFTKSSLNTQGLGIIMKKDFNGLRDLFTSEKRKKKKSKK